MSNTAVKVDQVWKKFRKGEYEDSLRDLIPALCKKILRRAPKAASTKEFWAIRDLSFSIQHGESLGIIGPNGAGKSTLLKVLSGILRPNRGAVAIDGRLSALIEVGAGFHGDLTGRENLYLNGAILGMKRCDIKTREDEIVEFAGVREFIDTPVKRYSSGMKARLGFAVAAHMKPDILLIDEVLSVGDARFRDKCLRHMNGLLRSGITVIFISHILEQVRALCPNTIVLDKGMMVYQGPTNGAIRKYLHLLSETPAPVERDPDTRALVRNLRFVNDEGREVLEWRMSQRGTIEMDLEVRQPMGTPVVLLNIASIGGVYLGTANSSRVGVPGLTGEPGVYSLRFVFDPLPFAEGDFTVEVKVLDAGDDNRCVWSSAQPRTFSVRGGYPGPLITCDGQWELLPAPASSVTTSASRI